MRLCFPIVLSAAALAASTVLSGQGLRPVKNNGTSPVCIMQVGQQESKPEYRAENWSGRLCVAAGETMQMTNGDFPPLTFSVVSGGGYYEADGGSVVIVGSAFGSKFTKNQGDWSLAVNKVSWDHAGKLVAAEGLRPAVNTVFMKAITGDKIKITSDVTHPKIANGNLYLTLEGYGQTEYWFKIKFGKITAIGKAGDEGEI